MLTVKDLSKRFGNTEALRNISVSIAPGCVWGLVGTNGSGKSTLLRLVCGVYSPDAGEVALDGGPVWENPDIKQHIFFVSDDVYFLSQSSLDDMADFYRSAYPQWSGERYRRLCSVFPLDAKAKLSGFSKGMRRQAALILALSCSPRYLLLDESFDGLDPVIRHAVRKLLSDMIAESGMTVIISSHNLRELEDFCDRVCLLHQGSVKLECAVDDIQAGFCKLQAVLRPMPGDISLDGIRVLSREIRGSVATFVCACSEKEALAAIEKYHPVLAETIGLTLEELFIYEMEAIGYDYTRILF